MVRNVKGFTMVELMIVIAIIGVLAVSLIPTFIGAQAKSRDTGRTAALANAATSLATFNNENGYFPGTGSGCLTDGNGVIANYKQNDSSLTDATATVKKYFQGGKAGVDPQSVKAGTGTATSAKTLACNVDKAYGYQAGKGSAGSAFSMGALVARMETSKMSTHNAFPATTPANNGELVLSGSVAVVDTDAVKLYVRIVE